MAEQTNNNTDPTTIPSPATDVEAEAIAAAKANVVAKLAEIEAAQAGESAEGADDEGDPFIPVKELPAWATKLGLDAESLAALEKRPDAVKRLEQMLAEPAQAVDAPNDDATETDDAAAAGTGDDAASAKIAELEAKIRALENRVERVPDALDDLAIRSGLAAFGRERWVAPDSKEAGNRRRLRETVETLRAGYAARKAAIPTDEDLVARAIRLDFADELSAKANAPIERRQSQMIARPASRQERALPEGRERAIANAREKLRNIAANT